MSPEEKGKKERKKKKEKEKKCCPLPPADPSGPVEKQDLTSKRKRASMDNNLYRKTAFDGGRLFIKD